MPLGRAADHVTADGAAADCPRCDAHHPEFDRAVAAVHYAAPWSTLITRLKFQGDAAVAKPLGSMVAQAVSVRAGGRRQGLADLVLPMPVSGPRLQERGFNQSWLLARHCAHTLALPCRHDVLQRTRHTARLMSLSAEDRALALREAFVVPHSQHRWVRGRHVALVDDVLTTGATLDAASLALREAGARSISAWVLARTP
jgi:ComF family protein